jgi:hypothetical protein
MGGEADVTPYLISRYFGLKSFSMLYGVTWTFYAVAGAIGPILMGKAFDVTGSYQALLTQLAFATFAAGAHAVPASLRAIAASERFDSSRSTRTVDPRLIPRRTFTIVLVQS